MWCGSASAGAYLGLIACDRISQFAVELRGYVFEHLNRCLVGPFVAEKLIDFVVTDWRQTARSCGQHVVEVVEGTRQILDEAREFVLLVDHPFRFGHCAGARSAFDRQVAYPLHQGLFVAQVGRCCDDVLSDIDVLQELGGIVEACLDLLESLFGESLVRSTEIGARRFVVLGRFVQASGFSPSCETQVQNFKADHQEVEIGTIGSCHPHTSEASDGVLE
jgi:hypothetical protein